MTAPRLDVSRRDCGSCHKVLYRDRGRAKTAMRGLQRLERVEGKRQGHLTVYRCPMGDGWHVGHDRRRATEA